jgi:hypothetical protein
MLSAVRIGIVVHERPIRLRNLSGSQVATCLSTRGVEFPPICPSLYWQNTQSIEALPFLADIWASSTSMSRWAQALPR